MVEELLYMYGLFTLFRVIGQSRLRFAGERRRRRRRLNTRKAAAIVAALAASSPRREVWTRARSQHWWETVVLQTFTDHQWLEHFRMRRDTFDFLCGKLRPFLVKKQTHLRQTLPLKKRVAVAVRYLATGTSFRNLSESFGIGKSTVHCCVWEVCVALRTLQSQVIVLPQGERLQETVEGFDDRWGFPQCCGAVDASHIQITPPSINAKDYYNHKGSHSIILQGVVDHLYRFTNINVGWAGSVHEATVLQNSSVFELAEAGDLFPPENTRKIEGTHVPLMLLGDPAYPLLSWLMKGYPDSGLLSREERHFNYRLNRARMTVECAFGWLKGRWGCLSKRLEVDVSKAPTVVISCCVLHNLCALQGEDFVDAWLQDTEESEEVQAPDIETTDTEQTLVVRQALTQYFSTLGD